MSSDDLDISTLVGEFGESDWASRRHRKFIALEKG